LSTIIIPSKYADIFEPCRGSLDKFAPSHSKILVRDGNDIPEPTGPNWKMIQGSAEKFVYARNVNLAIAETAVGNIFLCNDDVRFTDPNTIETLENVLTLYPDVGILSPKIIGGVGNSLQSNVSAPIAYTEMRLAFVFVAIRRDVLNKIGNLDERFCGYGWDDCDFCRRAVTAGWKMAATASTSVTHGDGSPQGFSSSFRRAPAINWDGSVEAYLAKWGDTKYQDFNAKGQVNQIQRRSGGVYRYEGPNALRVNWWDRHPRR
jgi:hypothetical protein